MAKFKRCLHCDKEFEYKRDNKFFCDNKCGYRYKNAKEKNMIRGTAATDAGDLLKRIGRSPSYIDRI